VYLEGLDWAKCVQMALLLRSATIASFFAQDWLRDL